MKRGSIAGRFIFVVLLILVVGQGSLWLWFAMNQKTQYASGLQDKVKTIAGLLANFSASAILSYNYTYLDQYIEALSEDDDIISVKVLDKKGNVLRTRAFKTEERVKTLNPFYIPWSNVYRTGVKSGEEGIGEIEITYSGEKANAGVKRLFMIPPIVQAMVFIFVTYAIYFLFQKRVGKPVEAINTTLSRVTEGDLTVEIPEVDEGEMKSVVNGLRFLLDRLTSTIGRVNSLSGNVAAAMDQLTVTLRNVSETAKKQSRSIDSFISTIRAANDAQVKAAENTDKLSRASSENVASLLEMRSAAEEIASSTGRLFKSTADSYAMIAEMSQTSKAIAESAAEVSGAVEDTSASVEEISASLGAVRENMRQSSELTARVRELLTDRGTLAVADAIEAMERITEEVDHSAKVIARLEERSKDIEKVLSVIKEVTEKTNLLSLNAAILAAQAGEYGKGFSVVADEIRSLSDRTSASAREIAGIVRMIQAEINEAVSAIRAGVEKVEEGKGLILKSGEAMGETLEAAQRSSQMAMVVEKATEEQAEGLKQIRLSMENVRLMIDQVAKATEEERRGSSHMLDSISDVKEVAELVKKGTEEHAVGTNVISRNLELTLEMVSQINQAAQGQQKVNEGVIRAVEEMKQAGTSAVRELEEVSVSFKTLREEIEILKKEAEKFRTGAAREDRGSAG